MKVVLKSRADGAGMAIFAGLAHFLPDLLCLCRSDPEGDHLGSGSDCHVSSPPHKIFWYAAAPFPGTTTYQKFLWIAIPNGRSYQKVKPRSLFYCLTIQNIPEHSPPIYTILTPKPTTWSPDKSPRSGRFCRSDLGPSCAIWGNSVDINNYFHDISLLSQSELPMLSM